MNADEKDIATVRLPKFKAEYELDLTQTLIDLGAADVFNIQKADLTGISGEQLFATAAKQNSVFSIYENGSVSVSASLIKTIIGISNNILEFNRPFIYMVVDNQNSVPVIVGTVNNVE